MNLFLILGMPFMASAIMYPLQRPINTRIKAKNNVCFNSKGHLRKYFALEAALIDPDADMVCSPISALLPLGKLALGAEKKTANELYDAIGVTGRISLKKSLKKLMKSLRNVPGVRLDIAGSIYVSKQASIYKKFLMDSQNVFQSGIQKISFDNPEESAKEINAWVSNKTHGLIETIIMPSDILPTTSTILVNAVYFSGKWKYPFHILPTDREFYSPKGTRTVKMMKLVTVLNYYNSRVLKSEILELPYEGGNASFVIILPIDKKGLPLLLKELKLAPELLNTEMNEMERRSIHLVMPKFKVQSTVDLKMLYEKHCFKSHDHGKTEELRVLKYRDLSIKNNCGKSPFSNNIGVKSIFTAESGLTKMVKNEKLMVSKAIQKTVIDVNESGTQAGVATALVIIKLSMLEGILVEVDHPFLFFIKINSEAIFAGVVNEIQQ